MNYEKIKPEIVIEFQLGRLNIGTGLACDPERTSGRIFRDRTPDQPVSHLRCSVSLHYT